MVEQLQLLKRLAQCDSASVKIDDGCKGSLPNQSRTEVEPYPGTGQVIAFQLLGDLNPAPKPDRILWVLIASLRDCPCGIVKPRALAVGDIPRVHAPDTGRQAIHSSQPHHGRHNGRLLRRRHGLGKNCNLFGRLAPSGERHQ